ncbi:Transcriptional regulator ATRX [Talaromyces islandicus]|uniref:Transcriptional regulator ATRX n=1 Tax=Talaromyces islandicus TaxID=28573 RepID=A0A0U1M0R5_TALIS|nr:Transcriptional regulator ATRX [Talaromyces islandicus]
MDYSQDDPFDWSVDQVVQYLCYNTSTPWTSSKNPSPMPDRQPFESALREHGITGEVLLNGRLEPFFRSTLKLHEGPFYSVDRAIQYARRNSAKYQAVFNQERLYLAASMPAIMNHHMLSHFMPNSQAIFNQATAPALPDVSRSASFIHSTQESANEGDRLANENLFSSLQMTQSSPAPKLNETTAQEISQPNVSLQQTTSRNSSPQIRQNEHIHVDKQGNKRRKLNLAAKGPSKEAPAAIQLQNPRAWYIGPQKVEPASIFYPILPDAKDDNWALLASNCSTGQRLYVKRKLFRFSRKPTVKLPSQDGSSRTAVFPYDNDDIDSDKPRFFTLYTSNGEQTTVTMESTADNEAALQHTAGNVSSTKEQDQYNYLLQKYPAKDDDDLYPVFGESGSEGGFDSDTWDEMDREREELALRAQAQPRHLYPQIIDAVMEECIKSYQEKWRVKHLPKLEMEAHSLWLNALRNKCRNSMMKTSLDEAQRLVSRLEKIKKELHAHEWTERLHLSNQCQSMEQTVFGIETQKWRVSVLESQQCPPKVRPPLVIRPKENVVKAQPDEESLDSDSGYDGLGDFIVDDTITDAHEGNKKSSVQDTPRKKSSPILAPVTNLQGPAKHSPRNVSSDESVKDVSRGNNPDDPANNKPRCGFYLSSDDESESNTGTPPSTMKVKGQNVEVIDLTGSPARVDFAETRLPDKTSQKDSFPKLNFDSSTNRREKQGPPQTNENESRVQKEESTPSDDDRTTLLRKMINLIPRSERTRLIDTLLAYPLGRFKGLVKAGIKALLKSKRSIRGLNGLENDLILRATVFYIGWLTCKQLQSSGINRNLVIDASINIRARDPSITLNFDKFNEVLFDLLRPYQTKKKEAVNSSTEDSDDNQQVPSSLSPRKKRKRPVKEDQAVKSGQAAAKHRVEVQEQQRKKLEERLELVGVSNTDSEHQPVSFEQPTIFLHPHIGRRVKPHQLAGVQFMWRELIQNEKRDGCLLAHTMGLGKTMQVISLLVTIAAAANSSDPSIRKQVPKWFHRSQTLILCPPSLIENWYEEFLMWTPKEHGLGPIRKVVAADPLEDRLSTVDAWNSEGGVLILSYSLFRTWVEPKPRKGPKSTPDDQDPAQASSKVRDQVLKGPRIVVADEAHQMKNKDSMLAKAAAMIESRSRIALTGSPLANNLIDYYAMVNWISPKYLDDIAVFRAKYLEPIEQGLFFDSTYQEQRRSLKKLQVLKEILTPKISRADISVLEGSLPRKVEFVITVPLTNVQKEAYNGYARSLLAEKSGTSPTTTTILSWLGVLGLCCNHPACFYNKLEQRAEEQPPKAVADDVDQETSPAEVPLSSLGFNDAMLAVQREILSKYTDLDDPKYSHRAEIFQKIVEESVRVGDKILCFSQSIPTLDYLESLLRLSRVKFNRLDGSTAVKTRQAAIKEFNTNPDIKVYLISTRAGGLGLNITGANRVIIFDFGFNPTWEEQAVARAYRLGQDKPVYIYRFLSGGTFEEIIHNKSIFKTQLAMRVVDKKNVERSASKSLGDYLFPVKDVEREDFSEYIGKDREVLDKILQSEEQSAAILNIALTETFCREDDEKLTEDEKKEIQEELELELLRQSDLAAYEKKMAERYLSTNSMPVYGSNMGYPSHPYPNVVNATNINNNPPPSNFVWKPSNNAITSDFQEATEPFGVLNNTGPPPIRPDIISTGTINTQEPPAESPAEALFSNMSSTTTAISTTTNDISSTDHPTHGLPAPVSVVESATVDIDS